MTKIGQLRDYVEVLRKVRTPNGAGGFAVAWASQGFIWCEIVTLNGTAVLIHDGRREKETVLVRMRAGTNLQMTDRINWRGQYIDIGPVSPVTGQPRWIEAKGDIVQIGEA